MREFGRRCWRWLHTAYMLCLVFVVCWIYIYVVSVRVSIVHVYVHTHAIPLRHLYIGRCRHTCTQTHRNTHTHERKKHHIIIIVAIVIIIGGSLLSIRLGRFNVFYSLSHSIRRWHTTATEFHCLNSSCLCIRCSICHSHNIRVYVGSWLMPSLSCMRSEILTHFIRYIRFEMYNSLRELVCVCPMNVCVCVYVNRFGCYFSSILFCAHGCFKCCQHLDSKRYRDRRLCVCILFAPKLTSTNAYWRQIIWKMQCKNMGVWEWWQNVQVCYRRKMQPWVCEWCIRFANGTYANHSQWSDHKRNDRLSELETEIGIGTALNVPINAFDGSIFGLTKF